MFTNKLKAKWGEKKKYTQREKKIHAVQYLLKKNKIIKIYN